MIQFEWDPAKARTNLRKHSITFEDAMQVFDDPYAQFEQDRTSEDREPRWRALGLAGGLVLLLVVHTVQSAGEDEIIRLISARQATRKERNHYDETRAQDLI